MIYIFVIIFAVVLAGLSQKRNNVYIYIFSGFLLVLLASLRSETVGFDVQVYVKKLFLSAQNSTSLYYFLQKGTWLEPLYSIVVYLAAKIFGTLQGVFFLNEILVIYFVYKSLWKCRYKLDIAFAVLIYTTVFYGQTYNTIRQQIAMSMVLYAFTFFKENEKLVALFVLILATGFHSSAVVAVIIFLLYWILPKEKWKNIRILLLFMMLIFTVWYDKILLFLMRITGIFKESYVSTNYLFNPYFLNGKINFPITDLVLWGVLLIISYINYLSKKDDSVFWLYISLVCFLEPVIAIRAWHVKRLFWYFEILSLFSFSDKRRIPVKATLKNRIIYKSLMMIFFIIYFVIMYIFLSDTSAGIYPYTFFWNR